MNQKLAIKNLGPGKRQQLEKTRQWLGRMRDEAAAKNEQLQKLSTQLEEARKRRDQYDREAATNENAALKCAGADLQIRKLEPQVTALEKSLKWDLRTIAQQIASVRDEDIFKAIHQELYDQLSTRLAAALREFFAPKVLGNAVAINLPETAGYAEVLRYLRRRQPTIENFDDARDALNDVIKQIGAILAGDTLLDIGTPKDPPPLPERPKPVQKASFSDADMKRLKQEGDAILSRWNIGKEANQLNAAKSESGAASQPSRHLP